MVRFYLTSIFILYFFNAKGQDSFIQPLGNNIFLPSKALKTQDGGFAFCYNTSQEDMNNQGVYQTYNALVKIDELGNVQWNKYYVNQEEPLYPVIIDQSEIKQDNQGDFLFKAEERNEDGNSNYKGLIKTSPVGDFIWYKKIREPDGLGSNMFFATQFNNNIVATLSRSNSIQNIVLSSDGEELKNDAIRLIENGEPKITYYDCKDFIVTSTNKFITVGRTDFIDNNDESEDFRGDGFVQILDENGNTETTFSIDNFSISSISEMSNGDLILVGNRTGYGASEFEIIPAVLKVNAVFDVLFAKVIPLKPHDFLVSYGATTQTDDIVIFSHQINKPYIYLVKFEQSSFSYDFVKVFPVLNSSLHPYLTTTDEDGFAFVGRLIDTITFNNPYFFYKTNPEGEIDGLNSQDLCLEAMYDWSPIIVEHDFEVIDANSYESDDTFLTLDVPLPAPVVGIPSVFPTAEFSLPNEICADNCTAPTNLNNEYADTWDWWVEGADNEIFTIPNPGQICWEESGTYTVRQIISFQNCLDTFEQTIIIYPEIEPTLPDSIDICANENSGLNGVSQNANNYLWSTGELNAEINIEASGLYILNMDNEKCSLTDSVQVNLVEATEISISRDTILCPTDFPYLIEADAPFATQVRWENGNENQERLITRAGNYTFFAESGGCTTSATVTVLENDCQVKVYIPTAFSPNNDGINDFWEVYGVNFKITEITIFDRWGNIVHTNQNNTIPWNGKTNDNDMPTGVYVYIITYKNLLTTETGVRKGDFTLIR